MQWKEKVLRFALLALAVAMSTAQAQEPRAKSHHRPA
jgi:hypothetical protein